LVLFSAWAVGAAGWWATAASDAASATASLVSPPDAALLGASLGAALGGAFAAMARYARRSLWRAPSRRLRVVVTGGTRGLGKALARELLAAGDAVAITGRNEADLERALREIPAEACALLRAAGGQASALAAQAAGDEQQQERDMRSRLSAFVCDVAADDGGASVDAAFDGAAAFFSRAVPEGTASGGFDVLICNAGASGGAGPLFAAAGQGSEENDEQQQPSSSSSPSFSSSPDPPPPLSSDTLRSVVRTNLLGTLRCAKAGLRHLQGGGAGGGESGGDNGGHLFLMDGAGSDGSATPMYSAYGATKAALPQLAATLRAELRQRAVAAAGNDNSSSSCPPVSVHCLSPGMMLTSLLLANSSPAVRSIVFNALCEQPETVAAFLAPRVRSAVARGLDATYPKFLTPLSAAARFASMPMSPNRFFDAQGEPVYLPEHERIMGKGARATARARRSAAVASRWAPLRAAYSASLLACAMALGAALGPQQGSLSAAAFFVPPSKQQEDTRTVLGAEVAAAHHTTGFGCAVRSAAVAAADASAPPLL